MVGSQVRCSFRSGVPEGLLRRDRDRVPVARSPPDSVAAVTRRLGHGHRGVCTARRQPDDAANSAHFAASPILASRRKHGTCLTPGILGRAYR